MQNYYYLHICNSMILLFRQDSVCLISKQIVLNIYYYTVVKNYILAFKEQNSALITTLVITLRMSMIEVFEDTFAFSSIMFLSIKNIYINVNMMTVAPSLFWRQFLPFLGYLRFGGPKQFFQWPTCCRVPNFSILCLGRLWIIGIFLVILVISITGSQTEKNVNN